MRIREAPFALRVVRRKNGDAAIVYRRIAGPTGRERLTRVAAISPVAFSAGATLLRNMMRAVEPAAQLKPGPFLPLDVDGGARVACYAAVASGLGDTDRLWRAADNLLRADGAEAAWWLALISRGLGSRPVRALRILVEAVP